MSGNYRNSAYKLYRYEFREESGFVVKLVYLTVNYEWKLNELNIHRMNIFIITQSKCK